MWVGMGHNNRKHTHTCSWQKNMPKPYTLNQVESLFLGMADAKRRQV